MFCSSEEGAQAVIAPISGGTVTVQSAKTCVVYDPHSGHIHHVHHAITLRGGREPAQREIEHAALSMARQRAGPETPLAVLHVDHAELVPGTRYEVNIATRALVVASSTDVPPERGLP